MADCQQQRKTARMGISLTNSKRAYVLPVVSDMYGWRDHLDPRNWTCSDHDAGLTGNT